MVDGRERICHDQLVSKPILHLLLSAVGATAVALPFLAHAAFDESATESLMRKSGCFKCHSITRRKDAPSYRDIAEKYKGKAGAEQKLIKHITSAPVVRLEGGDEDHAQIKTKDTAEVRNVVLWIMSR